METLRQTMVKSEISDLVNGSFVRKEGFDPSYVLTGLGKKISRVKLVGTVTNKFMSEDGNYSSITVEDDSGGIRAKAFGEETGIFDSVDLGSIVTVIGKVKEYNGEKYVSPEIVRKADINYENMHKLEVIKGRTGQKKVFDTVKSEMGKFSDIGEMKKYLVKKHEIDETELDGIIEDMVGKEEVKEKDHKPFLLDLIDQMDKGKGIEIKKLLTESKLKLEVFEEVMNELITEGLCYEPKPGFVKRV
jgi:RPA family protein